jgi:hypothetical protein
MADTESILQTQTTKSYRTAMYMLRFTPEEKQELEQKVRLAAAMGKTPLSLAEALRMGANEWLDELIAGFKLKLGKEAGDDGALEL